MLIQSYERRGERPLNVLTKGHFFCHRTLLGTQSSPGLRSSMFDVRVNCTLRSSSPIMLSQLILAGLVLETGNTCVFRFLLEVVASRKLLFNS